MLYGKLLKTWDLGLTFFGLITLVFCSHAAIAQQAALTLSSSNANPGSSVSLNLSLTNTGGAAPAGLEWKLGYPAGTITNVAVTVGPSGSAAGKSVSCFDSTGSTQCVLFGVDNTSVASGVVATVSLQVASGTSATSIAVPVSGAIATDGTGSATPAIGSTGTITLQPQTSALSAISCNPTTIASPGSAACAVTLTGAAPTGGLKVGLTSSDPVATVPASISVPAGARSVGFTASAIQVTTTHSASVNASASGISKSLILQVNPATTTLPGVSGLSCTPSSIVGPGSSSCTVTLNSAAPTGGVLVSLGSTDPAGNIVTFPGSVTVPATATRVGFTANAPAVTVTHNATLVASANGMKQSFPLSVTSASSSTWSATGTVSPTSLGAGINVSLTGAKTAATTTASSGIFSFSALPNGKYTFTPSGTGLVFTPSSRQVTVNGANITGINFTAQASTTNSGGIVMDARTSLDQNTRSTVVSSPGLTTNHENELLLAFISADSTGSPNTTVQSVSGGGLTWTLVARTNAQMGTSEIWRAFAPNVLNGASVSATLSQSVVSTIEVMTLSGVDTSGTNGSGAIGAIGSGYDSSGAPSATLVTTKNNSMVVGSGNDYDNAVARIPASGQSLVHETFSSTGDTYWVQVQNGPVPLSGTTITLMDVAPTSDQYNFSICEILAAGGN